MSQSQNEKFYELLKDFHTVMLMTKLENGETFARPMAVAKVEQGSDLWFLSSENSGKIAEIEANPAVHITCQRDRDCYLSIFGKATVIQDKQQIRAVWKEPFKVWFPEGVDDPSIALIHVTPLRGEYWDNSGINKIKYLFEAAKAYITKTTPEVVEGKQHGTVTL